MAFTSPEPSRSRLFSGRRHCRQPRANPIHHNTGITTPRFWPISFPGFCETYMLTFPFRPLPERPAWSRDTSARRSKVFSAPPPVDFVRNLRLNEARRQLRRHRNTLPDVAASVGFRDPTAFQRALAKHFRERPNKVLSEKPSEIRSSAAVEKGLASNGHDGPSVQPKWTQRS